MFLNRGFTQKPEQYVYLEEKIIQSINHHIGKNERGNYIISSFDENGGIIKYEDSANILALCHIDFE